MRASAQQGDSNGTARRTTSLACLASSQNFPPLPTSSSVLCPPVPPHTLREGTLPPTPDRDEEAAGKELASEDS